MRSLITKVLIPTIFLSGINCQLLMNHRRPPPRFGPPFGLPSLLVPSREPPPGAYPIIPPINSPFADNDRQSSDDGLDLFRLFKLKSIWDDDDEEDDDELPLSGNDHHQPRFSLLNPNPFGMGLLGDRKKLDNSGSKESGPDNLFSEFPSLLGNIFKPILDYSKPKPTGNQEKPLRVVPVKKVILPPQKTVSELITKHNLTWQDFISYVPKINIPGIQLTVNLKKAPSPIEPKKAAVMEETIAKLNDALKKIFPPSANITKVELNISEQGLVRPVIINALVPSANKTNYSGIVSSIADRLSAVFKKEKVDKKEVDEKEVNTENKNSNNVLVRFFYFISRRSSPPLETSKNLSKSIETIEGKTAAAESAYSTSSSNNGDAALSIIPIWLLSATFLFFSTNN